MRCIVLIATALLSMPAYAWPWDSLANKVLKKKYCDFAGNGKLTNISGKLSSDDRIVIELSVIDATHIELHIIFREKPIKIMAQVIESEDGAMELWQISRDSESPIMKCFN